MEAAGMLRPELQALPQIRERMTFIYLEHCKLNREDSAITATDLKGTVFIPAASISVLLLGALRVRDGVSVEEFSSLVFTEREIPAQVRALTGLAQESLVGAPSLKRALEKLLIFIGDDRLVCWNAAFDIAFLQV